MTKATRHAVTARRGDNRHAPEIPPGLGAAISDPKLMRWFMEETDSRICWRLQDERRDDGSYWQITAYGEVDGEECVRIAHIRPNPVEMDLGYSFNMKVQLMPLFCSTLVAILSQPPEMSTEMIVFALLRLSMCCTGIHLEHKVFFVDHDSVSTMMKDMRSGKIWLDYYEARKRQVQHGIQAQGGEVDGSGRTA